MFPFSQNERLVFSYIWLIGSRLFGIYLVMYALGRATDRTEILIVSVAGMLFGVLSSLMHQQQYKINTMSKLISDSTLLILRNTDSNQAKSDEYKKVEEFIKEKLFHSVWNSAIRQITSLIIFVLCFMRFAPLFSLFGG